MIILDIFFDQEGNFMIANTIIFSLLILVPLFFVSRWINLWYWKIDEFKKDQEEQIRLLKKIAGEKESED